MLNHSLSSLLHGCFFPSVLGFTLLRVAQRIKKKIKKNARLLGSYALSKSATKKDWLPFSVQHTGFRHRIYDSWEPTATKHNYVTDRCRHPHFISALWLALLQRPRRCRHSPALGRRRAWLWREISGRADLGRAVCAVFPGALRATPGTGAWGRHSRWVRHPAARGLQHQAHSPLPTLSPNISIPTEAWKRGSDRHETPKPCTKHCGGAPSSVHWKLTPCWLVWCSHKAKRKGEEEGTDNGLWAVNQTHKPPWDGNTGIELHRIKV